MSYAVSGAVQSAVYQRLAGDAALAALVGDAVFDSPPGGTLPALFVQIGAEEGRDVSGQGAALLRLDLGVAVRGADTGFAAVKAAAGAVSAALEDAPLALAVGRLVSLRLARARARAGVGGPRRREVVLTFRALVEAGD